MVRSEIVSKLSHKIQKKLKKSDLEEIIKIFTNSIVNAIRNGKSIELRNFGRFSIKKINERKNARNPKTGEIIFSPKKISVSFKMAKEFKNKFNLSNGKIN